VSTCRKCRRPVKPGRVIGPACLRRERSEAIAGAAQGYSDAQVVKASALLDSGGVEHQTGGLYKVRASDRESWYLVTSWDCGCQAARHGRFCAHRLAVAMYEAVLRVGGLTGPFAGFKTTGKAA
jgi:hypothetical protein